ncbi:hypothetical protein KI809_19155 [Geobacter pelophilus]|uniref:Uncharacterized protein n=1 Tax=Geoanaerobacter pelophilus TaxID=60036 RepID=A0AAW4LA61_9BACT|nr:hypothetical protein [Geoanaerobacter pelophilus]MBT0666432.1 hypothetical protein [Geoanaerobacter pelophilus]
MPDDESYDIYLSFEEVIDTVHVKKWNEELNLSRKLLKLLYDLGRLYGDQICDVESMETTALLIKSERFIKMALARLTKTDRQRLIDTAEYNKWESYAYTRTYNLSKPPRTNDLVAEIETLFGFTLSKQQIKRVNIIRKRAINNKSYAKKKGTAENSTERKE